MEIRGRGVEGLKSREGVSFVVKCRCGATTYQVPPGKVLLSEKVPSGEEIATQCGQCGYVSHVYVKDAP